MSHTSSHAENSLGSFDRRNYARQRIKSLSYVDLGQENGGIVLNISEGGLAVQAVGILVENPLLEIHFRLPESHEELGASGQVAWTSESRREAGIQFLDVPEKTRAQIRDWVLKQAPPGEFQAEAGSVREKKKQVLEMPPKREAKTAAAEQAMICGMPSEEFNAMFPSEKEPPPCREFRSPLADSTATVAPPDTPDATALPSESAKPTRLAAQTSAMESLPALEQKAKPPREKFSELLRLPSTSPARAITNEELGTQGPVERAAPILPLSHSPATFPEPVAPAPATPDGLPPFTDAHKAFREPAVEASPTEHSPVARFIDVGIAPPAPAEAVPPNPVEAETPTENTSTALPTSVAPDTLPLSHEAAVSRLEKDSPAEVPPPSVDTETRSSAEIVDDLRATLKRASATRKSPARLEAAKQESQTLPPSESTIALPPAAAAPVASARSAAPSPSAASISVPRPEKPAPAQSEVKSPMTGTLPDAAAFGAADKKSAQSSKKPWSSPGSFQLATALRWQPTGAIILVFVVVLAMGIAFGRGAFDGLRSGAGASTDNPAAQALPSVPDNSVKEPQTGQANPEVRRNDRRQFASADSGIKGSTEKQRRDAPSGRAREPRKTKSLPWVLSSPVIANRAVQNGTPEEQTPPAIQAQPENANGAPLPDAVAGPLNEVAKLAPPKPAPQPAPAVAEQGDRVVACSLLYRVEAVYPPEAAQRHIEGTVKLRAVINRDGRVMGLGVVSGPPLLVPAALRAAREWRYIPALLNGEPVEGETDIAIQFRLSNEADR